MFKSKILLSKTYIFSVCFCYFFSILRVLQNVDTIKRLRFSSLQGKHTHVHYFEKNFEPADKGETFIFLSNCSRSLSFLLMEISSCCRKALISIKSRSRKIAPPSDTVASEAELIIGQIVIDSQKDFSISKQYCLHF